MSSVGYAVVGLLLCFNSATFATLPDYFYRSANRGYRNVNAVNIQISERFNLTGWRGYYYQQKPLKLSGDSKWIGWDIHPELTYTLIQDGPVAVAMGGGWEFSVYQPAYFESKPSLQIKLSGLAGPLTYETQAAFEIRYIQYRKKFTKYRWRPSVKLTPAEDYTRLHLKPFLAWEGFLQKKQQPINELENQTYNRNLLVPYFNGVELGLNARLNQEIGLGLSDYFQFVPTRKKTGNHRIMTYLTWYFDTTKP